MDDEIWTINSSTCRESELISTKNNDTDKDAQLNSTQSYFTFISIRTTCLSSVSDPTKRIFVFAAIAIIMMMIGILIVYYNVPKPAGMIVLIIDLCLIWMG